MESVPEATAEQGSRWRYFGEFRRDLVLQLYLRKGSFWEAVKEARGRNGITATTNVPPSNFNSYVQQHPHDVAAILKRVVPEGLRHAIVMDWQGFIQACLLYDPPEMQLTEFDKLWTEPLPFFLIPRGGSKHLQEMAAPPIKIMRDPAEVREHLTTFYEGFVDALIEQYLVPLGYTKEQVHRSVVEQQPELWKNLEEGERGNKEKPYVVVDEYTPLADAKRAAAQIGASDGQRPVTGRPQRDPLVAVECAILHDHHAWKYEQLAERHGWKSDPNLASKYVEKGRKILSGGGQK